MTPQELNRQQRDAVRASLLLADDRKDRHNVYRLSAQRPCERCGQKGGLLFCIKCDGQTAA
jgi:ArsR family metal-binding transcriptional regulator